MRDVIGTLLDGVEESSGLFLEGKKISRLAYEELSSGGREAVTAVDGGSAPLLETPKASVQFCRVIAVTMTDERKEIRKTEGFVVATATGEESLRLVVRFHPLDGEAEELFSGGPEGFGEQPSLSKAAGLGRKALEARAVRGSEGVVVWDGSLTPTNPVEARVLKGVRCVALSKTSGVMGDWRVFSDAPSGCWRAHAFAETWFVKLHPRSRHLFRVDTDAPAQIERLVPWSCDPAFLGYPYPLVLADQLARVSNSEASALRTRLQAAAGSSWNSLSRGESTQDAHRILDSMQY